MEHITFEQSVRLSIDIIGIDTVLGLGRYDGVEEVCKIAKQIYNADPTGKDKSITVNVANIISSLELSVGELMNIDLVKQKVTDAVINSIESGTIVL